MNEMNEMNECQNLQQQLDDYLCERLSDFAKRRIDNHLRQCPICAKEVNSYQIVISEFRSLSQKNSIEPSLALQYSLKRLVEPSSSNPEVLSRNNYVILISTGVIMLGLGTVLSILNYYGAIATSLVISFISALIGTGIILTGLAQMKRKTKTTK